MKSLKQLFIESDKKMLNENDIDGISQQDVEFANEKYKDDSEEKRLWLKAVKSRNIFQKERQRWQKQHMDRNYKELEKYRRNKTKKSFGINDIKKILQTHGLSSVKVKSTAIRGFNRNSPNSYKIDSFDPQNITLYGITKEKFDGIINEIKEKGFNLENVREPSQSLGGVNISSFRITK